MGLSEEEGKRGMMARPKDHEKSSLWGRKEVELHSTCAQSVQRVFKGCGKFKVNWTLCLCLENFKCALLDQDGAVSLVWKKHTLKHILFASTDQNAVGCIRSTFRFGDIFMQFMNK